MLRFVLAHIPKQNGHWEWVARATSLCGAATCRAAGEAAGRFQIVLCGADLPPFARLVARAKQAGSPFHPFLLRNLGLALATMALLCATAIAGAADRNTNWATKVEQAGLPNLHRIGTNLYRCAQPTAAGLRAAENLGIKTVINLRALHSDRDEVESTKLKNKRIRFNTWHPEEEDVLRFLKIVTKTNDGPYLVHCLHGADCTGTMSPSIA